MDKEQKIEQANNIKKANNNIVIHRTPWIITGRTISNTCFKLTMDMIDKQPPKKIPVYKKINLKK